MTIWDKHPNYTEDELRFLVRAAASVLYDSAENRSELENDIFDAGPRRLAKDLTRTLEGNAPVRSEGLESMLGDADSARAACLVVLSEVRRHPTLAERVAWAYENERRKMSGVEMLLAGALLVLAVRIKSLSLPEGRVQFYESSEAVKDFIVKLVTTARGL